MKTTRRLSALAVCTLLLAAAPCTAWARPGAVEPAGGRVLVLPFTDVDRVGRIYWMSEGMAVLLSDDLERLGQPVVTRDDRRRAFDQLQIPLDAELTDATAIRIARLVGASRVVMGTLALDSRADGEQLVAHVRQFRMDLGRMDRQVEEQAPLRDLFALCARLARAVTPDATVSQAALVADHPPLNAFQDYIKGLLAQDPVTQIRYLQSSVALAPHLDRARLALWTIYSDQGKDDRALTVARDVPDDSRYVAQARFRSALSLLRLKRYGEADAALSALSGQTSAPVLNDLGVVQLRRGAPGDVKRAAYYFTQATKADPDNARYFFNLGYAYWLQRDAHAAVYWLREAVRRNPADGAAHFVLSVALNASGEKSEGDRERALAGELSSEYADAIRKAAPAMPAVPKGLERLDTSLGGPLGVEDLIVDSRQEDREATAAFYLDHARRLADAHDNRAAVAELKRCLFLSPYDADAQLLLGQVYLRLHRTKDAVSVLKISLWSQETADAHVALAQAYLQAKDEHAARAEALRALALDPGADEARTILDGIDHAQPKAVSGKPGRPC